MEGFALFVFNMSTTALNQILIMGKNSRFGKTECKYVLKIVCVKKI